MTDQTALTDAMLDAAATWRARLSHDDATGADWDAFTAWLEADAAHAAAYDRVCEAEDDLATRLTEPAERTLPVSGNDDDGAGTRRGLWLTGLAIAASFALALLFWPSSQAIEWQNYRTGAGETQVIALDGGSSIALNGNTALRLANGDVRQVQLLSGEAAFEIVDSAAAPFEVKAGGLRLVDQGTAFNVARDAGWIRVGVSEGSILVNPDRERVALGAGRQLAVREGSDRLVVTRADPTEIGNWRERRLSYRDAPIEIVAADLARNLGIDISVADTAKDRHFTGVIQLDGDAESVLATAAALIDAHLVRTSEGWRLTAG